MLQNSFGTFFLRVTELSKQKPSLQNEAFIISLLKFNANYRILDTNHSRTDPIL